jgi:hypothetical protein
MTEEQKKFIEDNYFEIFKNIMTPDSRLCKEYGYEEWIKQPGKGNKTFDDWVFDLMGYTLEKEIRLWPFYTWIESLGIDPIKTGVENLTRAYKGFDAMLVYTIKEIEMEEK